MPITAQTIISNVKNSFELSPMIDAAKEEISCGLTKENRNQTSHQQENLEKKNK